MADFGQALDAARREPGDPDPPARRRSPPRRRAAIATIAARRPAARPAPGIPTRIANATWGLLTSVDFAVSRSACSRCSPSIGMTLRQLPGFAFRSPTDYANEMDQLHAIYDPTLATGLVNALEQLQLFRVFSSTWFSIGLVVLILSIVACTIDRLPRLWRQSADIRVVQPDPYYDPTLPDRALLAGVDADAAARILRRHRFVVRRETADGATYLYGDRNRWTKMATLLTHTGLVMFLVAAAVTSRLGDEQGLVVAEGDSLTVQPIGTPGLLLVRNLGFDAPGFDTGKPSDFTTHLAVYQDGKQVADKTIRVNDPLTVGGYTFHQNGFGPAPDVVIRDQAGKPLWTGPIPMTDSAAGFPLTEIAVPGRDVALQLLLQRSTTGRGSCSCSRSAPSARTPTARRTWSASQPIALARGESATPGGTDFSVELRGFSRLHAADREEGPGPGDHLGGVPCLITGIVISFWLPRRRVWGRLDADGRLSLVMRADRYVDAGREFGRLLDDLVRAARRAPASDGARARADTVPAGVPRHRQSVADPLVPGPQHRRWQSAGYTPRYRPDPGRLPVPSTATAVRRRPRRDSVPASIPRRWRAPASSGATSRPFSAVHRRPQAGVT